MNSYDLNIVTTEVVEKGRGQYSVMGPEVVMAAATPLNVKQFNYRKINNQYIYVTNKY